MRLHKELQTFAMVSLGWIPHHALYLGHQRGSSTVGGSVGGLCVLYQIFKPCRCNNRGGWSQGCWETTSPLTGIPGGSTNTNLAFLRLCVPAYHPGGRQNYIQRQCHPSRILPNPFISFVHFKFTRGLYWVMNCSSWGLINLFISFKMGKNVSISHFASYRKKM